jgi:hypothetical protein
MDAIRSGISATRLDGVSWRKSRHSNSDGSCVEAGALPGGGVAVRDSCHPDGPALIYTRAQLAAFAHLVKEGGHDRLVR